MVAISQCYSLALTVTLLAFGDFVADRNNRTNLNDDGSGILELTLSSSVDELGSIQGEVSSKNSVI